MEDAGLLTEAEAFALDDVMAEFLAVRSLAPGAVAATMVAMGAWQYNRPCVHQYVGKSQSCMVRRVGGESEADAGALRRVCERSSFCATVTAAILPQ